MNFIQIRRIKVWEPLQQTLVLMLVGLAIILAGCTSAPQRSMVAAPSAFDSSPWATPSATMRWNEYACDLITSNKSGQQGSVRLLAYLNLAIHNAIVVAAQQGRKSDGAAAGAAAAFLAYYFPNDATAIAARLSGETAALGSGPTRDDFAAVHKSGRPWPPTSSLPRKPTDSTLPGPEQCPLARANGRAAGSRCVLPSSLGWER